MFGASKGVMQYGTVVLYSGSMYYSIRSVSLILLTEVKLAMGLSYLIYYILVISTSIFSGVFSLKGYPSGFLIL